MWFKFKLARAQWLIVLLAVLLQRSPAIRVLTILEKSLSRPVARIVQGTTWLATTMGVFHATAGATQFNTAPGRSPFGASVGEDFEMTFTVTGAPVEPSRWVIKGNLAPGLSLISNTNSVLEADQIMGSVILVRGQPTTAGIYVISAQAFNTSGQTDNNEYEVQINVAAPPPQFLWNPQSMSVPMGGRAQFFFEAEEEVDTIRWRKNGMSLDGESGPTLILAETNALDAGVYSVSITKNGVESISAGATLTIEDDAAAVTVELSNQGFVEQEGDVLESRLVIEGPSAATILLRGLGPELEGANAPGVLGDPRLELSRLVFEGEEEVGTQLLLFNNDWEVDSNAAELAAVLAANGKSLEAGSKDSAILVTLPEGVYRVKLSGDGEWNGTGLAEMTVIE